MTPSIPSNSVSSSCQPAIEEPPCEIRPAYTWNVPGLHPRTKPLSSSPHRQSKCNIVCHACKWPEIAADSLLTSLATCSNIGRVKKDPPVCAGEPVTIAKRVHPFPSRTRKLSSSAPMILEGQPSGKIGRRRFTRPHGWFFFCPRSSPLLPHERAISCNALTSVSTSSSLL